MVRLRLLITNVQPECVNLLFYYYYSGLPIQKKLSVQKFDAQIYITTTAAQTECGLPDVPMFLILFLHVLLFLGKFPLFSLQLGVFYCYLPLVPAGYCFPMPAASEKANT